LKHFFRNAKNLFPKPGEIGSNWTASRAAPAHSADLLGERGVPLVFVILLELYELDVGG